MTSILWPLIIVIASVAVLGSVIAWCRIQVRDLKAASHYLDESYKAAQRLVKSSETPERVLDFVEFFMGEAGKPSLARRFSVSMIRQHLGAPHPEVTADSISSTVHKMPKGLAESFATMIVTGMLASAAADPIFSRLYLRAVNAIFGDNAEQEGDTVTVPAHPSIDRAAQMAADISGGRFLPHAA